MSWLAHSFSKLDLASLRSLPKRQTSARCGSHGRFKRYVRKDFPPSYTRPAMKQERNEENQLSKGMDNFCNFLEYFLKTYAKNQICGFFVPSLWIKMSFSGKDS